MTDAFSTVCRTIYTIIFARSVVSRKFYEDFGRESISVVRVIHSLQL